MKRLPLTILALSFSLLATGFVTVTPARSATCDKQHPRECREAVAYWKARTHRLERAVAWQQAERRHVQTTTAKPSVDRAYLLARLAYGDGPWITLTARIQSCESTGGRGINPFAKNRTSTAAGAGQYLDSTWRGTRAASLGFSVYDIDAVTLLMAGHFHAGGSASPWFESRGCWS